MTPEPLQHDWDELAEVDPLWNILSEPDKRDGRWDLDAFFATGSAEIAAVLERGRVHGYPAHRERALDFGCGVGRLTRAMAAHFDACLGLDISPRMIELARRWNQAIPACRFGVSQAEDLRLYPDAAFDFVYCRIVLQHVPARAITGYITELVRVLRPRGLLVFEVPSAMPFRSRAQGRRRAYPLLRRLGVSHDRLHRTFRLTPIRMSFLPESEIVRRIEPDGRLLEIVRVSFPKWVSSTYYVTRDAPEGSSP